MAEKDKLFWMLTLSDFLNREDLFVDPSKQRGRMYILSSGEFGKIGMVSTVADIFELLDQNIHDSYVNDLFDEAIIYGMNLPKEVHGVDDKQYGYWAELRNAYEAGELDKMKSNAKEYFENHNYEFDVLELVSHHFEDFTIKEWFETDTYYYTYTDTYYHTYRVGCSWEVYGHITVRAKNKEEAVKMAQKVAKTCPLPDDGEYLEDAFEIDTENIEEAD